MKQFLFLLFVGLFSWNSFSQDLPPNPEPGKCYIRCRENGKHVSWQEINCDFNDVFSDQNKVKTLQIKLANLNYDVEVSGEVNLKTIAAYTQYTKDEKKRHRRAKKKRKETKRN
ncbi:hypothetical protein FG167_10085 [Lacinutrix sp. WUR7]|uniref:hypothetical protein n=1 Tax=Lacinutrix sp. WUR7 TaxID=2653681 RepID=UPI00193EB5D8|nr:hypothetical protein [Lacinutrix sp. WUR7]QRM89564.1 hypothetical protein FG167_10085 [Lacinutrix sp. WUR7]